MIKFVVTITELKPDLFGTIIAVDVLERKRFYHRWRKTHQVTAQCKSWNGYEGYEWYNEKGRRMAYCIESTAYEKAKKVLKNKLCGIPIMVDWKALKEKYPINKSVS